LDLLAVQVVSGEVLGDNSPVFPVMGGRKYRTFVDAIGLRGVPCSAYFAAILLDKDESEITRKIRWLNDLSGNAVRYPLVFRTPANTTSVTLAYRINTEDAVPGEWCGRLSNLKRVKLRKAPEKARECFEDLGDAWKLECAFGDRAAADRHIVDVGKHTLYPDSLHMDFTPEDIETIEAVRPFTMTSNERIYGLIRAVHYVVDNDIPGALVECGVWKGGSMMVAAITLLKRNAVRDLYLFDTYSGMPEPTEKDLDLADRPAADDYHRFKVTPETCDLCFATLEEVRVNMLSTGYPADRIHFVKGRVEETIPDGAPETIAVLRLDTDWYASTRHEMEHLFERLSTNGILIADDYGHWQGMKQALDEYVAKYRIKLFLSRLDYTGRIGVKVWPRRLDVGVS